MATSPGFRDQRRSKTPLQAEHMLLSLGLGDPRLWPAVLARVQPEQCDSVYVRRCLSWVAGKVSGGTLPGVAELLDALPGEEHTAESLAHLRQQFPGAQALEYWTEQVREIAARRGLWNLASRLKNDAADASRSAESVASETARALSEIVSGHTLDRVLAPEQWLSEFNAEIERRSSIDPAQLAIPTGIPTLDRELIVEPGDLVIVAAETGVGKSALGLSVARAAAKSGRSVLYANTEMTAYQLATRILGAESGIPIADLRRGCLAAGDWQRLSQAQERMKSQRLFLTRPLTGVDASTLAIMARAHQAQHGLDLLVVDYVGRLDMHSGADGRSEVREYQVLEGISKQLKGLAQDIGCAVYLLVQRTEDGHLAGSRRMRNDADAVLEILPIPEDNRRNAPAEATHWIAVTKARSAPGDYSLSVRFDPGQMRWTELARQEGVATRERGR